MSIADSRPAGASVPLLASYRPLLLAAGFCEAVRMPGNFYRRDTEWTAFALNLREKEGMLTAEYGWASTAFVNMDGPDALTDWGCLNINLHERLCIPTDADSVALARRVRALYDAYHGMEKDALLAAVQEKRKAFIAAIAVRMKPLGFRKKASTWTRALDKNRMMTLYVQKSAYSDAFYFNLRIDPIAPLEIQAVGCCDMRVTLKGEQCLDWQSLGEAAMTAFLDEQLLPAVRRWMDASVETLTREGNLRKVCIRKRCQQCWVEEAEEAIP